MKCNKVKLSLKPHTGASAHHCNFVRVSTRPNSLRSCLLVLIDIRIEKTSKIYKYIYFTKFANIYEYILSTFDEFNHVLNTEFTTCSTRDNFAKLNHRSNGVMPYTRFFTRGMKYIREGLPGVAHVESQDNIFTYGSFVSMMIALYLCVNWIIFCAEFITIKIKDYV